jgi:hypothetical protein
MGQATADLPDPLEPAAAPSTPAGADDLLAQLAGDEIDRLLAEAEVEQEKLPPAASPYPREADAAFDAALRGAADSADPAQSTQNNLPVVSPAPNAAATLNQQMQQVFAGLTPVAPGAGEDMAAPAPPKLIDAKVIDTRITPAASMSDATSAMQPVIVAPADGGTSLAERDGLRAGEADALSINTLGELEEPEPETNVPLVLRPLVWINAPFAAVPEDARAALGKVAIVTLVNAIGVLAYVLIFRR